jgi:hypothetical protein
MITTLFLVGGVWIGAVFLGLAGVCLAHAEDEAASRQGAQARDAWARACARPKTKGD